MPHCAGVSWNSSIRAGRVCTSRSKANTKYPVWLHQNHYTALQATISQQIKHGAIHLHTMARPIRAIDGQKPILPCSIPPTPTRSRFRPGTMDLPRGLYSDRRWERSLISRRRPSVNVDATRQLPPSGRVDSSAHCRHPRRWEVILFVELRCARGVFSCF